jgi:hypothetical protein
LRVEPASFHHNGDQSQIGGDLYPELGAPKFKHHALLIAQPDAGDTRSDGRATADAGITAVFRAGSISRHAHPSLGCRSDLPVHPEVQIDPYPLSVK